MFSNAYSPNGTISSLAIGVSGFARSGWSAILVIRFVAPSSKAVHDSESASGEYVGGSLTNDQPRSVCAIGSS